MAITQLSLYNQALALVGERKLTSLGPGREAELLLDVHYEEDPTGIDTCLELVQPDFAILTAQLASPTTPSNHTLQYRYSLPSNYLSMVGVFSDSELAEKTERYVIEGSNLDTDIATNTWIRYVRDDTVLTDWSPSFANVVVAYLAVQIAPRYAPQKIEKLNQIFASRVEVAVKIEERKKSNFRPIARQYTRDTVVTKVYNQAISMMGLQNLVVTTSQETRLTTALDAVMANGAVDYLLEITKPKFATATVQLNGGAGGVDHDMSLVATLPSNYLSLVEIHSSSDMDQPLTRYMIEGNTIATSRSPNWLRYVVDDKTTADWTSRFKQLLAAYLAEQVKTQFVEDQTVMGWLGEEYDSKLLQFKMTEGFEEPEGQRPLADFFTLSDGTRKVYNGALALLGLPPLANTAERNHVRIAFDTLMDNGAVNLMLEASKPKFAMKTVELATSSPSPEHNLNQVFTLPSDFVTIVDLYADDELDQPITRYLLEGTTIATEVTPVYLRYIAESDNSINWTAAFKNLMSAYLADQVKARFANTASSTTNSLDLDTGANTTTVSIYNNIRNEYESRLAWVIGNESIKELERAQPTSFTLTDDYRHIYNNALNLIGKQHLINNSDNPETRAALDVVMNGGAVNFLLELTKPQFALKTDQISGGGSSTEHDLDNVINLPSDYLCLLEVHADPLLDEPVSRYIVEGSTIASQYPTLYIRYVSDTPTIDKWTPAFKNLLAAYLADQIKARFASDSEVVLANVEKTYEKRLQHVIDNEGYKESDRSQRSSVTLTEPWRQVYNDALLIIGKPHIVSVDDDSERRSILDAAVATGTVATLLEDMSWGFATVSSKLTYNPSLEPDWGYKRVFDYPTDMHRLDDLFYDEFFMTAIKNYADEGDRIFADVDELYIKYVSTSFLDNPSNWPNTFKRYVAAELANQVCGPLRGDRVNADKELNTRRHDAKSHDAMTNPPQIIRDGRWSQSRGRSRTNDGRP